MLPKVKVTGLASDAYGTVVEAHRNFSVDFDDAYQVAVAISQDLSIATLDRDFKRVTGLEWVLERYKERTPKDKTVAERFNTYRFADYKEDVITLLQRVCAVSVQTSAVVAEMAGADE